MAVAAVVTLVDGGPTAIRGSLFDVIVVYQNNYGQCSWFHGHVGLPVFWLWMHHHRWCAPGRSYESASRMSTKILFLYSLFSCIFYQSPQACHLAKGVRFAKIKYQIILRSIHSLPAVCGHRYLAKHNLPWSFSYFHTIPWSGGLQNCHLS